MDERLQSSKGLWQRCVGLFNASESVRMVRVKAPILDVSTRPVTVYPGREIPGVVSLGLDGEDVVSATILQVVARLDPGFRPDDLPPEIDFALEERLCPDVRDMKPGDWLCIAFLYNEKSYGIARVQKIDSANVVVPVFGAGPAR